MKEKNEKNLVPAKEIEQKTPFLKVTMGIDQAKQIPPRPDLAGLRLTPLTGGQIYMVNPEGYLQWIPNPETYNNLFRDWNGVYRVDVATLPIGTPLSNGAVLAQVQSSAAVYIVTNNQKRWIMNSSVMDKYNFNWKTIYVVPQVLLDSIPSGGTWS
ncbi:MAG: hypothetical protein WC342_03325 [Methanoregula sp.]|jgi:hypothetical protein